MRSGHYVPVYKAKRPRIKQHTKRQLHKLAEAKRREAKAAAKSDAKVQGSRQRRDEKLMAAFEGVDPEKTLELIGE